MFFFRGISKPDERACSADKRFFKTDARTKHTHTPYIHTHKDKDKDRPKAKIYRQPIAKKTRMGSTEDAKVNDTSKLCLI